MSLFERIIRLAAMAVITSMLFCGCKEAAVEPVELLDPVEYVETTYTVTAKDVETYHVYTNAALYHKTEALYFQNGGYVGNFEVAIGESVKAGDLILQMDLAAVQERYDTLNASLEQMKTNDAFEAKQLSLDCEIAELKLQRAKDAGMDSYEIAAYELAVDEAKLACQQQKEQSDAAQAMLQSQLGECREQIENSKIYAPFDGIVTYLPDTIQEKVYLTEDQPAAIVMDETQVSVRTDYMSEQKLSKYQRFTACIGGVEYPLSVVLQDEQKVAKSIQQGKTIYTEFAFTGEIPEQVGGSMVAVNMYYGSYQNVLTVPYQAVIQDAGSYSVYLQLDGKKYTQRVKVLAFTATEAIIAEGLQEGDVVYVG